MPSVGQPYINALLKNSKCYHTAEFIVTVCLVNADGVPCSSLLADNRYVNIESLNSMCVSSNISCSSTCRSGINEAKEAVGCCVNRYNTSLGERHLSLSYSVWKSCGVESPGFCVDPLSLSTSGFTSHMERAVTGTAVSYTHLTLTTIYSV